MNLKEFLNIELIKHTEKFPKNKDINDVVNLFMNGAREAKWNHSMALLFTNKFEGKISKRFKHYIWFLEYRNLKWCPTCDSVLESKLFSKNKSSKDGLATACKQCRKLIESPTAAMYTAKYKANKIKRTPTYINLEKIKLIYKLCPKDYQVDHIIPLNGHNVCGLHIENNLQYLLAKENNIKLNTFKIKLDFLDKPIKYNA